MATTKADLPKFVVWAPDYPDALNKRLEIRPRHLENINRLTKQGIIRVGGGVLTSDSSDAASTDRKFFGSCVIIEADSLETVRKIIEEDVYYKEGVWDRSKLLILPIMLATALPPIPFE